MSEWLLTLLAARYEAATAARPPMKGRASTAIVGKMEQQRERCAEARAGGDAEQRGRGHGIAEYRLIGGAGDRKSGADHDRGRDARKAHQEQNGLALSRALCEPLPRPRSVSTIAASDRG